MNPQEGRDRLLDAMIAHVPFDGWSEKALRAGERDLGEKTAELLFPGGAHEALAHFSRRADRQMVAALEKAEIQGMRRRVAFAVNVRLDALDPYREAVRRGLSFLAMPHNSLFGARLLYRTVDDIWHAAGDRSADFSFYTRRGLLAAVVASTTLFWLDDRSEGRAETRAFLDRRLQDVMRIQQARGGLERARRTAFSPLRILREVARDRYGSGSLRRRQA